MSSRRRRGVSRLWCGEARVRESQLMLDGTLNAFAQRNQVTLTRPKKRRCRSTRVLAALGGQSTHKGPQLVHPDPVMTWVVDAAEHRNDRRHRYVLVNCQSPLPSELYRFNPSLTLDRRTPGGSRRPVNSMEDFALGF
jgi:hypothetical protein